MNAVDRRRAGMASGVVNAVRQLGQAFGIAVLGALLYARLPAGHATPCRATRPARRCSSRACTTRCGWLDCCAVTSRSAPSPPGGRSTWPAGWPTSTATNPGIEITLAEDSSAGLIERLSSGRLDVALIGLADAAPPELGTVIVTDRPLVAVMGPGHPLACHRSIRLGDLAGHPLITLPGGSGVRAALDAGFAAARLRPRVAFEASDPAVLLRLAGSGLGIAILPASEASVPQPAHLREVALTDPAMRARLALAWRASTPAGPATALVQHITRRVNGT